MDQPDIYMYGCQSCLLWSAEQGKKKYISLSAFFAHENLVSRDGFGSPVPRRSAHLHTQAAYGPYLLIITGFLPSSAAATIYLF